MSSVTANRLKKGMLIKMGDDLLRVFDTHHLTQGNKRAHMQAKMRDIRTGRIVDHKFRAEEDVERAILEEHEMQFLYKDGDQYHFMNTETYEQIHLNAEELGEAVGYLLPETKINVEFYDEKPMGVNLPVTVDLKVTETVPGIKGATAAAQVKPATCETGLVVIVPAFVNEGDMIRISTETGEYLSRV
ncbi:MAG: elongation factor P [Acidobacteria bacterium]|nr:MAG: elongation factor P [Acidobacteriota bacterium]